MPEKGDLPDDRPGLIGRGDNQTQLRITGAEPMPLRPDTNNLRHGNTSDPRLNGMRPRIPPPHNGPDSIIRLGRRLVHRRKSSATLSTWVGQLRLATRKSQHISGHWAEVDLPTSELG